MSREDTADWLSFAEAQGRILEEAAALPSERCPLASSMGRVLAADVVAPIDLPPWDNSAMDGFAVQAADVLGASPDRPRVLRVVDDVPAGQFPSHPLRSGEATRVMTGAPVPEGADSVVRVEHTDGGNSIGSPDARVLVFSPTDAGRNIRPRGDDLRRGTAAIRAGTVLHPAHIGLAASVGCADLPVIRRPRVAILASGDELVDVERFDEVESGRRIVSSNSYALEALLVQCGMDVQRLGIAADSPESIREYLEGARGCDAIVTSAGVSVGEHDYLREVFRSFDTQILFWRVRMRPGSALAFGRVHGLGGIPWFGLPGNPVSTLVTAELLVRPALLRMAGHTDLFHPRVWARLTAPVRAAVGFTHFLRASIREGAAGWEAVPAASQSSGVLSALAGANALIVVAEDRDGVPVGDTAPALLLDAAPLRPDPGF